MKKRLAIMAVSLLATIPPARANLDNGSKAALGQYRLTPNTLDEMIATARDAKAQGLPLNDAPSIADHFVTIDGLAAGLAALPGMPDILSAHKLTARDYVMASLAAMQAVAATEAGSDMSLAQILGAPNPANITFYQEHKQEVQELMRMGSDDDDNGDSAGSPESAEQVHKYLDNLDYARFDQCVKAIAAIPEWVTFELLASFSHEPTMRIPPDVIPGLADTLKQVGDILIDPRPKKALYQMSAEVRRQQGQRPIELSPAYLGATNDMKSWTEATCSKEALHDRPPAP